MPTSRSQCPELNSNKIEKNFNKTYIGLKTDMRNRNTRVGRFMKIGYYLRNTSKKGSKLGQKSDMGR